MLYIEMFLMLFVYFVFIASRSGSFWWNMFSENSDCSISSRHCEQRIVFTAIASCSSTISPI